MIRIYNTLSKKKEDFIPLEEGKVRMYVCGPTVYNFIHIGNARPMIVFDTVRRYLEHKGYEVNFVSNFTDVDDKIIKKANEEGVSAEEISQRYIAECKKDMDGMNIKPATTHPLATQEIDGMIAMISDLIEKGYAYAVNGTVYFRTRKFKDYGKLSHKNLDDLQAGNRSLLVSGEDEKEDSLDFVLWKPKKEGEPYWTSPWGDGRPGWHIECSVMSKKYLGEEIDIHGGGEDLIFPHHENEIAQSEACCGHVFSRYWMHNAFLNIDNRKMSKSAGNFFTVREIAEKYGYEPIRYLMISSQYRSPINYSVQIIEQCKASLARLYNCAEALDFAFGNAADGAADEALLGRLAKHREDFITAMDDDLNTANGLACIFELVSDINKDVLGADASKQTIAAARSLFHELCDVLGLLYNKMDNSLDAEVERLIEERSQARKEKNWARADEIRDELKSRGIVIEDTPQGVKWHVEQ